MAFMSLSIVTPLFDASSFPLQAASAETNASALKVPQIFFIILSNLLSLV